MGTLLSDKTLHMVSGSRASSHGWAMIKTEIRFEARFCRNEDRQTRQRKKRLLG